VRLQPDGRIVAAGWALAGPSSALVARVNRDGSPDLTFGANGKTVTDLAAAANDEFRALAFDPDGRIVAAGTTNFGGAADSDFAVARYLPGASVLVSPQTRLATTEAGGTAQFSVMLSQVPAADVTISLTPSVAGEGAPSAASLTFTPADALTPQTVTVTGLDD